jgi:hypothetical protein
MAMLDSAGTTALALAAAKQAEVFPLSKKAVEILPFVRGEMR